MEENYTPHQYVRLAPLLSPTAPATHPLSDTAESAYPLASVFSLSPRSLHRTLKGIFADCTFRKTPRYGMLQPFKHIAYPRRIHIRPPNEIALDGLSPYQRPCHVMPAVEHTAEGRRIPAPTGQVAPAPVWSCAPDTEIQNPGRRVGQSSPMRYIGPNL